MKEIEVKLLEVDADAVQEKLLLLGAEKILDALLTNTAFDAADGSIRTKKDLLRLRSYGKDKHVLTYKQRRTTTGGFQSCDEFEVAVHDPHAAETFLAALGYTPYRYTEKRRVSYLLGGARIEIDSYPGIPTYIEIEGTPEQISETLDVLGYTMSQTVPWTAAEVRAHYGNSSLDLRFPNT